MKKYFIFSLFLSLFIFCAGTVDASPDIKNVSASAQEVIQFSKFELTFDIDAEFENPYDPEQIDVQVIFTTPSQKAVTINAFYYQAYDRSESSGRQVLTPVGEPVWKARFAPFEPGTWSYRIVAKNAMSQEISEPGYFKCLKSESPGFVRIAGKRYFSNDSTVEKVISKVSSKLSQDKKHWYFCFDNGQPYFPIGENMAWGDSLLRTFSYDKWCNRLADAGGNYIRLWFAVWSITPEWKDTGLGRYSQERMWDLDYILDLCKDKSLYMQICFLDHGQFSRTQDAEWHNNPYNVENGGPCNLPTEFLTNETAKKYFKRRLRYMIARWGYSTNLMSWEWFNEADLSELSVEDLPAWIKEMDAYLKTIDPYRHLVTTSFYKGERPAEWDYPKVWSLDEIDFTQLHIYDKRDYAAIFTPERSMEKLNNYNKPFIVAEFGWIDDLVRRLDNNGIHMHNGFWSGILSFQASVPVIWYWDLYVDPNDLYYNFKAVASFLKDVDFVNEEYSKAEYILEGVDKSRVVIRAMESEEKALMWISNAEYNLDQHTVCLIEEAKNVIRRKRGQKLKPCKFPPDMIIDAKVKFTNLTKGKYEVLWYDTFSGEITKREEITAASDGLLLNVPSILIDTACKVRKISGVKLF